MSIFGRIKDAIWGKKAEAAPPAATDSSAPIFPADTTLTEPAILSSLPVQPTEPVDVEAVLTELGAGKNLNWRTSIVDLMKLVGIDSSLSNREELAKELGYTGALGGSAEMNIWLHKAVMAELAKNGGKVPADLLD
jgi:hypothetical protein